MRSWQACADDNILRAWAGWRLVHFWIFFVQILGNWPQFPCPYSCFHQNHGSHLSQ